MQTFVVQSEGARQRSPALQRGHEPPQSTLVSLPFCTSSLHVDAWQTLAVQTPEAQSVANLQALPARHPGQEPPPQSMSVSVPFSRKSVHSGAWQTPVQCPPPAQSAARLHTLDGAQPGQMPPQSTSVSVPSAR